MRLETKDFISSMEKLAGQCRYESGFMPPPGLLLRAIKSLDEVLAENRRLRRVLSAAAPFVSELDFANPTDEPGMKTTFAAHLPLSTWEALRIAYRDALSGETGGQNDGE